MSTNDSCSGLGKTAEIGWPKSHVVRTLMGYKDSTGERQSKAGVGLQIAPTISPIARKAHLILQLKTDKKIWINDMA